MPASAKDRMVWISRTRFLACASAFLLLWAAAKSAQAVPLPSKAGSCTRVINFPTTTTAGSLLLISTSSPIGEEALLAAKQLGQAKGTMTITVPPGSLLLLDANRKLFDDPSMLKQITPATSIDALKVSFGAAGDSESNLSDKALKCAPYFKNLSYLDVDQSDATDAGLIFAQKLPKLRCISMVESRVKGACLKDLAALPHLSRLKMDRCVPDQSNFVYLEKMPGLIELHFRWMNIDQAGMKYISKCTQLQQLDLSRNHLINDQDLKKYVANLKNLRNLVLSETSVTDAGMQTVQNLKMLTHLDLNKTAVSDDGLKYLSGLKKMQKISLFRTKVTTEGLRSLQNLPLKEIVLPRINYVSEERARLQKMFPNTLMRLGGRASQDTDSMFAPQPK